jgi:hypothetical protein
LIHVGQQLDGTLLYLHPIAEIIPIDQQSVPQATKIETVETISRLALDECRRMTSIIERDTYLSRFPVDFPLRAFQACLTPLRHDLVAGADRWQPLW